MSLEVLPNTVKQYLQGLLPPEDSLDQYLDQGVIAGGAVANLIYNIHHQADVPINDIDLFVFKKSEGEKVDDAAQTDYTAEIGQITNNLRLSKSERRGFLNIITVTVDFMEPLPFLAKDLIENFDINCTKAALILSAKPELLLHDEYKYFIQTKQLLSTGTNTPIKTLLRMLKKKREFNAYLSDNHVRSIYQLSKNSKTTILAETFEKYPKELSELQNYFKFFKMSDGKYLCKYLSKYEELHRNEKNIMKNQGLRSFMIEIFDLKFSKNKLYNKYLQIRPYKHVLKSFLPNGLLLKMQDSFSQEGLVSLEKVLRQSPASSGYFTTMNIHDAVDQAKTLLKFEEDGEIYQAFLGKLRFTVFQDMELAYKEFKKAYLAEDESLILPLPISEELKLNVKELVSSLSLKEEGKNMAHCVGGYIDSVKNNYCRIFSIKTESGSSTIEIRFDKDIYFAAQHKGKANSFPEPANRKIAQKLIGFLNKSNQEEIQDSELLLNYF